MSCDCQLIIKENDDDDDDGEKFQLEGRDVLPNINRMNSAEMAEKCCSLSLVILTFDLALQIRLCTAPNTSSM